MDSLGLTASYTLLPLPDGGLVVGFGRYRYRSRPHCIPAPRRRLRLHLLHHPPPAAEETAPSMMMSSAGGRKRRGMDTDADYSVRAIARTQPRTRRMARPRSPPRA